MLTSLDIDTRGRIDAAGSAAVEALVRAVLIRHDLAADGARVRLTAPARATGPVVVQVNLRVHGAPARVQVAGPTVVDALALGAVRLDRQIRRLTQGGPQWPWPDPERRPLASGAVRRVTRIKQVRPHLARVCQAVAAMNALDYDVHLYRDVDTGQDAIVYRSGPSGVRLARQWAMCPPANPVPVAVTVNSRRVPELTVIGAAVRLARGTLPFAFFTNVESGRGNVLYRRYDGNLALLEPEPGPS